MKYIGAHVSMAGGVENAPPAATAIGAKAFAMFTKNQRQWKSSPLTAKSIELFKENLKQSEISPSMVLPHDGYLINLGSSVPEAREKSLAGFLDEAERVEQLGLQLLNFHPGNHLDLVSEEDCLNLIADAMNTTIAATSSVILVIEATAGQGTSLGYKFEHLAYLIDRISNKQRVGVCIDTCHIYSAGYDLKSETGYNRVWQDFERIVGFKYLKAMHINDSKVDLGKRVDRHESLGKGKLGWDFFKRLMADSRFDNIPLILETIDETLWPEEIKTLYSFT